MSEQAQRDNILVAAGDRVTPGQHIGNLLSQGTDAHVDFSILEVFEPVMCPLGYFSPEVAMALENLWNSSAVEKRSSLPDLCN